MRFYQLKIVVEEKKFEEFIESLRFLSSGIRKEQGCLDFSLYRDLEKNDVYRVIGEWKTRQAMEKIGVFALAEELGVETVVFDEMGADDWVKIEQPDCHWKNGFYIARPCLEADALVQLARLDVENGLTAGARAAGHVALPHVEVRETEQGGGRRGARAGRAPTLRPDAASKPGRTGWQSPATI